MNPRTIITAISLFYLGLAARAQGPIWVLNPSKDASYSGGKVGVGTAAPLHQFDISGGPAWTTGNWGGALGLYNGAAIGWPANNAGQGFGLGHTNAGFFLFRTTSGLGTKTSAPVVDFTVNNVGAVGVGTTFPAAKLHVFEASESVTNIIETGGGINAWAKLRFKNVNGQWDIGTSRGFNGDVFYIDRIGTAPLELQLSPAGNLGLGVTPVAKLHLFDPTSVSHRIETGGATNAWSRIEFANGNGQWNVGTSRNFNGDQLYFARQGSTELAFTIQPNGDAFVNRNLSTRSLTIRGGADLAEPFQIVGAKLEAGSVVVIDEENPGQLKCSTLAYDTRVAGVVSGANGIHPGISLHQEGVLEGGQEVALSGRVYVQADTSSGAIRPGDLLTTSGIRGHAMKAADTSRAMGTVLGKAMSSLDRGTGLVLVLVTLQ